jgi:uncharacterized protein YhaN
VKIARLDLYAFGPFTNARFDFEHKPAAMQLVYGPNEAGKSTTLRALTALLYGVPVRTGDAHLHEMTKLRVGGTLLDERGHAFSVVRRKGAKHTLLDENEKPLPESALTALLGGLDENLFRQMFGLDHERLRQGAEALLAGGGNLGEGLFDAGTGARAIRDAMESLKAESEALFKARGRTPKLNVAIDALRERQRALREGALSPQAFLEQRAALAEARTARDSAVQKKRALLEEQQRLKRAVTLIPLLSRYTSLSAELEQSGEPVQTGTEEWDAQLRELLGRLHGTRKTESELPRHRTTLELLERELTHLKNKVGSAGVVVRALDTPTRTRIRNLADEQRTLWRTQAELERMQLEQTSARQSYAEKLAGRSPGRENAELARMLERIEREGVDAGLSALELEIAQAEAQLWQRAEQLGLREQDMQAAALAKLELPDDLALAELEETTSELERERAQWREAERNLAARLSELQQKRALLLVEGELATLADLTRAREQRDALYRTLLANAESPAARANYERAVLEADSVADRLRREAHTALELARLEAEERAVRSEADAVSANAGRRRAREQELAARTERLLGALGLAQLGPRAARQKLVKLASLVEQAAAHGARVQKRALLESRARELTDALDTLLGQEKSHGSPRERIAQALVQAKARLDASAREQREAEALRSKLDELDAALHVTAEKLKALRASHQSFQKRLDTELERLGIVGPLSVDELFACMEDLTELQRKRQDADKLATQLRAHQEEVQKLAADVRSFVAKCLPEPGEGDLEQLLTRAEAFLRAQREARRDREERLRELAKLKERILAEGDGAPIEALRAQVASVAPDVARARLAEIEAERDTLEDEIAALNQTIGAKEAGLSLLERPSSAVALAEELQSDLSSVRSLTRRYLEIRLSLALLTQEVELYRTRHQGPVLSRASALFPQLTLQRYRALGVEYDDQDEAVLCCVREDGKTVRVSGLSDGTRDQLYLALRVASIERFLESNPPLPLVLDDAFIHFDDGRAEAALSVLGQLCEKTQVLFFTHHARMVELAQRALGKDRLMVHELDLNRGAVKTRDDGPLFSGF